MTFEQRCRVSEQCLPEAPYRAMLVALHDEMLEALAQPEQEPVAWMYDWFCDGKLITGWIAHREPEIPKSMALNIRPLYTTPPQRPWVEPTGNEWFDWWRVSPVANETEAEIDFGDFLIIALAVVAKLKEKNG
jgi:hypothetical protein